MQGVNRVSKGMSSMHVGNDADESNNEKFCESTDASDGDSEPTSGACFH